MEAVLQMEVLRQIIIVNSYFDFTYDFCFNLKIIQNITLTLGF